MALRKLMLQLRRALSLLLLLACVATATDTPANVAGTWKIKLSGEGGSANQTIGPRQSGPLEGTVDGNNIQFHVKTRVPLDYTGTVDGDTMKGTMSGHGKAGNWTAERAK